MVWSHGKSAMVCALLAALTLPLFFLFGRIGGAMFIVSAILLVVGMGCFWSALWKTRCRDLWAWLALVVSLLTIYGSYVLTMKLID